MPKPRPFSRRATFVSLTAAAALCGFALVATPAWAADIPIPGGTLSTAFEIDGDMAGANDWDGVLAGGYPAYTTSQGAPSTGILDRATGSEYCVTDGVPPQDDPDMFPGSQRLQTNPWTIGPGSVNKKSDLCASGSAFEIVDVDGQQHVVLYQYWTRAADGTGDLTVYQEFAGPEAGRDDDVIIEFDYNASGSGDVDIAVLRWNGSDWVSGTASYQAAFGSNGADGNVGTFGEMAVDLTATGLLTEDGCVDYQTGRVMSRTGNSQNAQLQDVFVPTDTLSIGTCGGLTVSKETNGPVPGDVRFPYVIDQADGRPVHDDSLVGPVADSDASVGSISGSLAAGESHTWENVIAQPDYDVRELVESLPAGVSLDSIVCTYVDYFQVGAPTVSATLVENGVDTGATFPVFQASIGAPAPECVITNTVTALTLNKTVVNDHGGTLTQADFTLTATPSGGGAPVIDGPDPAEGDDTGASALVPAGTYVLSETSTATYTPGTWSCTGGTLSGNTVTVATGASVVCGITNDDVPAQLTLVKAVDNAWGGTAVDTDFTLTATGPTPLSGTEGSPEVTGAQVSAGTYELGETAIPGYELAGVACWTDETRATAITLVDGDLVLANGASAVCELQNVDTAATLTLVKEVVNDHGGVEPVGAWTLSATGPQTLTGVTGAPAVTSVQVPAGAYTLAESGPGGYAPSGWTCTGGSLSGDVVQVPLGVDVTCTITNDDIAPKLTLVKEVVNDHGGTAAPTDWTLTATGPTSITGAVGDPAVTGAAVTAGTYTLAETGPGGYAPSAWVCDDGTTGTSVTLALGSDVTCTITNDDIAPKLTLVKTVVNDHGGTSTVADWTLTATGPVTASGTTGAPAVTDAAVSAGTYALTETGPAGYAASDWVCDDGTTGTSVTLALAADVTCTITNDDAAATLTLVKAVVNDHGGTAAPQDWTLSATGPATLSGVTGDAAVTAVAVPAGSYALAETGTAGYAAGEWTCTGGTVTESSVAVANGADVTCTITNDDIAPRLTLEKLVVNDDGGEAVPTDWTLTATGPVTASGVTGDPAITAAAVTAGTYTLAESGPGGYTAGAWTCDDGQTGGTVALAPGADVTCTITNDDEPVDLALTKEGSVESIAAGVPFDYTLTVTNIGTRDLDADDTVVVTDVLPEGMAYVSGPPTCSAAAQTVTCTVDPAQLTAGATVVIDLTVQFTSAALPGEYVNLASVTTEDDPAPENPTCPEEPAARAADPGNNVDCAPTVLTGSGVTAVKSTWEQADGTWSPSDGVVSFGSTVQYRIDVTAAASGAATEVVVTDVLLDGLQDGGAAACSMECTIAYDAATSTYTFTIASIAAGQTVTVQFEAIVPAAPVHAPGTTVTGTFDNVAAVATSSTPSTPTNTVTVEAEETTPVTPTTTPAPTTPVTPGTPINPPLAQTGGDVPFPLIGLALLVAAAGAVLIARRRRA